MVEVEYQVNHEEEFVSVPYGTPKAAILSDQYLNDLYTNKGYSIQYNLGV